MIAPASLLPVPLSDFTPEGELLVQFDAARPAHMQIGVVDSVVDSVLSTVLSGASKRSGTPCIAIGPFPSMSEAMRFVRTLHAHSLLLQAAPRAKRPLSPDVIAQIGLVAAEYDAAKFALDVEEARSNPVEFAAAVRNAIAKIRVFEAAFGLSLLADDNPFVSGHINAMADSSQPDNPGTARPTFMQRSKVSERFARQIRTIAETASGLHIKYFAAVDVPRQEVLSVLERVERSLSEYGLLPHFFKRAQGLPLNPEFGTHIRLATIAACTQAEEGLLALLDAMGQKERFLIKELPHYAVRAAIEPALRPENPIPWPANDIC